MTNLNLIVITYRLFVVTRNLCSSDQLRVFALGFSPRKAEKGVKLIYRSISRPQKEGRPKARFVCDKVMLTKHSTAGDWGRDECLVNSCRVLSTLNGWCVQHIATTAIELVIG